MKSLVPGGLTRPHHLRLLGVALLALLLTRGWDQTPHHPPSYSIADPIVGPAPSPEFLLRICHQVTESFNNRYDSDPFPTSIPTAEFHRENQAAALDAVLWLYTHPQALPPHSYHSEEFLIFLWQRGYPPSHLLPYVRQFVQQLDNYLRSRRLSRNDGPFLSRTADLGYLAAHGNYLDVAKARLMAHEIDLNNAKCYNGVIHPYYTNIILDCRGEPQGWIVFDSLPRKDPLMGYVITGGALLLLVALLAIGLITARPPHV